MQKNLEDFLSEKLNHTEAQKRLRMVINAIAISVRQVAAMIEKAPLTGQLGKLDNENIQGE